MWGTAEVQPVGTLEREVASDEAERRGALQRDLWARTAEVAGRLNRAHGELVEIAVQLLEGGHWGDGGFRSAEHYFVVRAGLSPAHARDVVAVARRRSELPEARTALRRGRLSLDQVAVVAHHVPQSHQRSMTDLARHATVPQLRRVVSRHAFAVAPGADGAGPSAESSLAERRACARPELSMRYDRDGRFQLRYSAPATVGALVEQAVKEAKDALFLGRTQSAEVASEAALPSYADAIEELANRSLASVSSTSRAAHYRVYMHLSTDGAWVGGGHAIPMPLVQRFLSEGVLQPVWETEGRPVNVGRDLRILPLRSRRLIEDRDRGCRFPGCTTTRFVEIHHLLDWANGGATDDVNLVSLCPFHHDAVSRGDFTMTGDPTRPDGLVVVNRYGLRIGPPPWRDLTAPAGGDPPIPAGSPVYEPPTGERAQWCDLEVLADAELPARLWRAGALTGRSGLSGLSGLSPGDRPPRR
jgi:hypothetical protein